MVNILLLLRFGFANNLISYFATLSGLTTLTGLVPRPDIAEGMSASQNNTLQFYFQTTTPAGTNSFVPKIILASFGKSKVTLSDE